MIVMNTIFVNGCFDILHRGHIEFLQYAKSLGDKLIVAIDSDKNVRRLKGFGRPINHEKDRKFVLEALECVDRVHIFMNAYDLKYLVWEIMPDIMVVGSDWKNKEIIGAQYAKEVIFFNRIEGYSTSKIIQNIANW